MKYIHLKSPALALLAVTALSATSIAGPGTNSAYTSGGVADGGLRRCHGPVTRCDRNSQSRMQQRD